MYLLLLPTTADFGLTVVRRVVNSLFGIGFSLVSGHFGNSACVFRISYDKHRTVDP